jgi:hypothetical protein
MIQKGLLKTPSAFDATVVSGKKNPVSGDSGSLAQELMSGYRLMPTPRAAEYKGTGPLGSKSHQHRLDRDYLDATVQELTGQTGQLNPDFVREMMGYPKGWHDDLFWIHLERLCEKKKSSASFRKRQQQHELNQ